MSEVKHTPGPWYPGHLGSASTCQCTSVVADGYFGSICQVSTNNGKAVGDGGNDAPPRDEAIANMHLIAAAPDLLGALKDFVSGYPEDVHYDKDSLVGRGRAAINKAEGRS
jgi:hypothetical protein